MREFFIAYGRCVRSGHRIWYSMRELLVVEFDA